MNRQNYCIANWKMTKNVSESLEFANNLLADFKENSAKMVICPPFTSLYPLAQKLRNSGVRTGAQNVYFEDAGAFTAEVSLSMLRDAGAEFVILGHSERRHVFGESDEDIRKRFSKVLESNLTAILCIGEKLEEREAGQTQAVLERQLSAALKGADLSGKSIIVAYEPVWAIGTGVAATLEMVSEAHGIVRKALESLGLDGNSIPILYGGSVKPANCEDLQKLENVDGFLIGGASLEVGSFQSIYASFN